MFYRDIRGRAVAGLFLAACIAAALLAPVPAHGAGTGDDPRPTKDVLTRAEAARKQAEDAKFHAWLRQRSDETPTAGDVSAAAVVAQAGTACYLWTPTFRQERSYWCGPAAVQIIASYWGSFVSQSTAAVLLGTTSAGTDFSRVDDVLRFLTQRMYYYYGPITTWDRFIGHLVYGICVKRYPIVADVSIDGDAWPYYAYDHSGHILPVEAFDSTVAGPYHARVNDPYNEIQWRSGGGYTLGHMTYDAYFLWWGVRDHFRHALIR